MKSESQFHLNECANRERLRHHQEEQEKRQRQLLLANLPLGEGMRVLPKVNYAEADGAVPSTSSDGPALKRRRVSIAEFLGITGAIGGLTGIRPKGRDRRRDRRRRTSGKPAFRATG